MKITSALLLAVATFGAAQDLTELSAPAIDKSKPVLERPLVESNKLRRILTRTSLLAHGAILQSFADRNNGNRAFGTAGHNATVAYIKKLIDATGYYDTEIQSFPYGYSEGNGTFAVGGANYETSFFTYSPGTDGPLTATLVPVANVGCESSDFPASVAGNIALISRGTCEFGLKAALAGAAGASGAIIYNNDVGTIAGTLGQGPRPEGPYVPVLSISGEDGQAVLAAASAGNVEGTLTVNALGDTRWSSNLIATTKTGDKENIVFAGAHSDSVAVGPGLNDNGSGSIGILDVALRLPLFSVKNAVRFAWWTAEEYGLVGSEYYVANLPEEERAKIALYLNFDMIASPNYVYAVYDGDGSAFNITGPAGSDHIEHTFTDYFKSVGLASVPSEFDGRSDYGPFLDVGIPAGGLFTGAEKNKTAEEQKLFGGKAFYPYDVNYHAPGDNLKNCNVGAWIQNTKAIAHSIATYARDLKGIPRGSGVLRRRVEVPKKVHSRNAACGSNHVHNTETI